MKKSILLSFLALLLPSMALAATYSGTPTPAEDMATKKDANGCYQISSAEDLYGFAAIVNGNDGYTKNTSACGKLMDNIVVNENVLDADGNLKDAPDGGFKDWTPIGTEDIPFSGSFDGDGHTISGLYFNDDSKYYVGLFGNVEGTEKNPVTIKDVGVVDSYIKGKEYVGGVVGFNNKGGITNCYNRGSFIGGNRFIGGVVGYTDYGSITNSYNSGAVKGSGGNIGGVVGYNAGGSITNSFNSGSVNGNGDGSVGGVVGYNDHGSITNSFNSGSVNGNGDGSVGGVVGKNYGGIMNCYNIGSVKGSAKSGNSVYVGGIVGKNSGSITNSFAKAGTAENLVGDGTTEGSGVKSSDEFANGTVATILHDWCETYAADGKACAAGGANGTVWGQHVGHDVYPVLSSTYDPSGNLLPGEVKIDLDYVLNEGSIATGSVSTHTYGTKTVLPVPTRAGYTFEGWYESANFSGGKVESISADAKITATSQTVGGTTVWKKKYYAKWIKIPNLVNKGSVDACYEIADADELYTFADFVNGGVAASDLPSGYPSGTAICGKLKNNIVVNENVLDADGNLNDAPDGGFKVWTPIGTEDKPFSGSFDGNGHTISGLYFNDDSKKYVGLFGYVTEGTEKNPVTIKDVGVVDSYIKGQEYVGGVVGYNDYGSITNSFNSGSVNGNGDGSVGGVVGKNGRGNVTNCYNIGSVKGSAKSGNSVYVGGIVGKNSGSITNSFAMAGTAENLVGDGTTEGSGFKSSDEFKNGTVATILHDWCELNDAGDACKANGANGAIWGQHVGHDVYPVLSSTYDPSGNLLPGEVKIDLDYVLNEGSIATGSVSTHTYGTKTVLPVSTRGGYTFVGWYESANFSGGKVESISADAKITATSQTVGGTTVWKKKYYAKWIRIPNLVNKGFDDACYEIADADELYSFAAIVNGDIAASDLPSGYPSGTAICGKLKNNIVVNENVLDADGKLNSGTFAGWTPIGLYPNYYTGIFDGQGHAIRGLFVNGTSGVGLFGGVDNGVVIRNVGVEDSYFYGTHSVGALVGLVRINAVATIENSYNSGSVTGSNWSVGGLVGGGAATISNSYNSGTVTGSSDFVGGLVGDGAATISNSYNSGTVTGYNGTVGGLVGEGDVKITNSYNSGTVTGSSDYVGGLVGQGSVTISASYNEGLVRSVDKDDHEQLIGSAVGGLVGRVNGNSFIANTYNAGSVKAGAKVGGLVGNMREETSVTIVNSHNVGQILMDGDNGAAIVGWVNGSATVINSFAKPLDDGRYMGQEDDDKGVVGSCDGSCDIDESMVVSAEAFSNWDWDDDGGSVGKRLQNYSNEVNGTTVSGSVWGQSAGDTYPKLTGVNFLYGITYNLNGGSFTNGAAHAYTSGSETVLAAPSRNGYTFAGWFESADFSGSAVTSIAATATGAKTFYAKWIAPIVWNETDECYEIYNADGLYKFADIVNGTNGETATPGACGKLMDNIVVNENVLDADGNLNDAPDGGFKAWTPIGNSSSRFSGSFDGNGKKISGLYFNASQDNVGVFGFVTGGTADNPVFIKDVSIVDSYIKGQNYVGGLVGYAERDSKVSITNSYSGGIVSGHDEIGGLLGSVGFSATVSITNSYNVGAVNGDGYVGGLVGDGSPKITNSFAMLVSKDGLEQPLADDKTLAEHIVGSDESYDEDAEKKKRFRDADDFHDGSIAILLHDWCEKEDGSKTCKSDGKNGLVWGQHVGHDAYPVLAGTYDDAENLLPGVVKFDLDYVLNGGVNAEGAVATYVYGKETVLPVPTRAGYTFEGWYESANFSGGKVESISADAKITATSQSVNENTVWTKKFYAKWSGPIEYTVTYNNVNGAINTNPTAYTVDTEKVNLSALARDGYKFLGWFDGKGDDANEVKKIAGGEAGNVILYAHWSIESYEIKVAVNDSKMGTVSGAGSYEYGAEITLVATAADGYKFSNWEDDAKASATRKVTVTGEASYKANFEKVAASSSSKKASSSSSVKPGSSSSVIPGSDPESGSSTKPASSSSKKVAASSSSAKRNSSSSAKKDAIVASAKVPMFSVTVMGRNLQIAGAPVGEKIAILDMQGRVLNAGLASTGRVDAANFNVAMPRSGSYMVRIGNQVQHVNVK